MMNDAEYEIHIDPEFRDLVYPLSARAYHALEESMLRDGCNTSIKVWNHQVLDGHSNLRFAYNMISLLQLKRNTLSGEGMRLHGFVSSSCSAMICHRR